MIIHTRCRNYLYFCIMEQNKTLEQYKYFIDFILPENMLDYFELVHMEESPVEELPKTKMDRH